MEKIKSIDHVTFNTRHVRKSKLGEVDKGILMRLADISNKAMEKGEVELLDGTILELFTAENNVYAGTVSAQVNGEKVPLFTTMGTKTEAGRKDIVKNLRILKKSSRNTENMSLIPPAAPVIVDYLYDTLALRPDVIRWSGDFAKCLGWYMLAPESFVIGE